MLLEIFSVELVKGLIDLGEIMEFVEELDFVAELQFVEEIQFVEENRPKK